MSRQTISAGGLGLLFVVSVVFWRSEHPDVWWESIPGFLGFLGFAGSYLLVFLAKSVATRWLERPRSYYDA